MTQVEQFIREHIWRITHLQTIISDIDSQTNAANARDCNLAEKSLVVEKWHHLGVVRANPKYRTCLCTI